MGNVLFTQEMTVGEVTQDLQRVATTPYVKEYSPDRKKALIDLLIAREGDDGVKVLRFTQSLCPGCVEEEKWDKMKIDSVVFVRHDRVWQLKECAEHGIVKSLYYADYGMYKKAESFQDPGIKILNPHIDKSQFEIDCPNDCGLCVEHESHTGLGNIVVTNRCDLTCWYCLPFDEELLVRENGTVSLRKIGELVEQTFQKEGSQLIAGGETAVPSPTEVLTFKDGKSSWTPVQRVYRRKFTGKLKKVRTSTGRTITVTEDHRFLVAGSGKITRKPLSELVPDDRLVSSFSLPSEERAADVDLAHEFSRLPAAEQDKLYVRNVQPLFTGNIQQRFSAAGIASPNMYAWKARDSIPFTAFSSRLQSMSNDAGDDISFGVDAKNYTVPRHLPITPDLAKLVGYFISDGHYAKGDLWLTAADKSFADLKAVLQNLGLSYSLQEYAGKTRQMVIGNSILAKVFEYVFLIPRGAAHKRLPAFAFTLPLSTKLALLSGLFNGDGYVIRGKRHASLGYATVSSHLARDMLYLLSSIGIFARLYHTPKEKIKGANYDLHKLYISGKDMERLAPLLDLRAGHLKRLENLSPRRGTRIERLGDFILEPVAAVEDIEAHEQPVYDIEVEEPIHGFIAGDGVLISNCFFYAKEGEPIYEPSIDQIRFMLKRMKNVKPIGANAIQFTGGEPTLREDLPDIIRVAKEVGYDHVQLNTNAIRLCHDPTLAPKLRDAGVNNLYMSFDGMTPQTNPKNYWEAQGAIENCRKAGIGVVLVPTVIGGINDHELGDIIRFGAGHLGVVRSVNFQPVSLVGRMPDKLRMEQRITIPGAIKRIEEQTDGQIGKEAWFPVPCARQITDFIEALKEEPKYRLSIHFACGSATYVFKDEHGKMVPITNFFDIEGFFNYLGELTNELHGAKLRKVTKAAVLAKLALNIRRYMDNSKKPKNLNLIKMLTGAMTGGNYHGLADFHYNSLFVGMMHFQDPYNWDLDRIHKCDIHYATPDGKVIPFCTFNVIPELYRDKIQRKFSIPASEWEAKTGKKISDVYYHRTFTDDQKKAIIGYFNNFRRNPLAPKPKIEPDWGYEAIKAATQALVAPAVPAADVIPIEMITSATKFGAASAKKRPTMSHPAGAAGCGTSGGCS